MFAAAAPAQDEIDMTPLKVVNLNRAVAEDIKVTWLDCAQKVFPDVEPDYNGVTRSIPIRSLSLKTKSVRVNKPMRITKASNYWFESEGELRFALMFHLEEQYEPKVHLDALAIYRFKPSFELVDAIDARFGGWVFQARDVSKRDEAELVGGFTELEVGTSGAVGLINRWYPYIYDYYSEEKHRFLLLDGGKLRVVFELPVLINKKNCDAGDVSHIISFNKPRSPKTDRWLPEISVEQQSKPIPACHVQRYYSVHSYETFRLKWDAKLRKFQGTLAARGGEIFSEWGKYAAPVYPPFEAAKLFPGAGFRTELIYNPQTGKFRLAMPAKLPRGASAKFEFLDEFNLAPKGAKNEVRAGGEVQIISEETKLLAGGRRESVYQCQIQAFGERTQWNSKK